MAIRIEPYTTAEQAAEATAFNQRMRAQGQTEFLLSERPPEMEPDDAPIRNRYYVARDEDSVRGGLLLAAFPATFGTGAECDLLNCREPLSEAVIDPKYSFLGLRLLKFMQQQGPYLFALGMGGETYPFPRLLKSAGWTVFPVPFLFRVVRAPRFLRELQLLRASPARRMLAGFAAASGLGKIGISALQFRSATAALSARGLKVEPVTAWDGWADELWEQCRGECSFAVRRDLRTVRALYPLDGRTRCYLIRREGQPVGWVSALLTPMQDHKFFGNLQVATLLDAVALDGMKVGCIQLASRALAHQGAELLVTNQSHASWVGAFRAAGYLSGPSNFILAVSKPLAAEINAQAGGMARVHFTRGDSDGRIHL
jgi:hypothetical protein